MGKRSVKENKNTYMALLGEKTCEETVIRLTAAAKEALHPAFDETRFLEELADSLATRNN